MLFIVSSILIFIGWIWSIVKAAEISALCVVANLFLSPISQLVLSVFHRAMRAPMTLMVAGLAIASLGEL